MHILTIIALLLFLTSSCKTESNGGTKTTVPTDNAVANAEPASSETAPSTADVLRLEPMRIEQGDSIDAWELLADGTILYAGDTAGSLTADGTVADADGTQIGTLMADGTLTLGSKEFAITAYGASPFKNGAETVVLVVSDDGTIMGAQHGDAPAPKIVGPEEGRLAAMVMYLFAITVK